MPKALNNRTPSNNFSIIDALLFVLAASAMAIISISFLLWLRF